MSITRKPLDRRTSSKLVEPSGVQHGSSDGVERVLAFVEPMRRLAARRPLALAAGVISAVVLAGVGWTLVGAEGASTSDLVFYNVQRSDLPIVVTERGNLQSQLETTIRCGVESNGYDRSGNSGTQIIFIVPNGKAVTTGELLVELDSAPIRERLDLQELDYQRALSEQIQANARYTNQRTQNETAKAEAELKVQLANLELEMYGDKDNGTYGITHDDVERRIEEAKNAILEARASLELQKTEREGIETLFKLGYKGKGDLDQSLFKFLQAEDRLAGATNDLKSAQAALRKLESYEYEMQKLQLEGNRDTAERSLEQVQTDNVSLLAQAKAAKDAADQGCAKELERLEKYKVQLENCKIYAPHDGMAVYAVDEDRRSSSTQISEGALVRERQRILTLPDLSRMLVKTAVHESVLDQVHPGLPATVKIDAFPDRTYSGVVESVAVLPQQGSWGSSQIKVYDTIIKIPGTVEQLKPGMTAVVDIHVDRLKDVLAIPVQAIVQVDGKNWCYVQSGRGVEKRPLELGKTDDKFVHVVSGLTDNEVVVLNPMAILERSSKQNSIAPDKGSPELPVEPDNQDPLAGRNDGSAEGDVADAAAKPGSPGSARPEGAGTPRAGGAKSKPRRSPPNGAMKGPSGTSKAGESTTPAAVAVP